MSDPQLSPEGIAEAFSRHRFAQTFDHLAPDIRWTSYGGPILEGKDAVVNACEESSAYLDSVSTRFRSFRTIARPDVVVTDAVSEYVGSDGETTVVASCDLYDFVDGQVKVITSYTVELNQD